MTLTSVLSRPRTSISALEAIYERRAIRAYTSRKVNYAVVGELLDAAVQAPSAMNAQPWAFVVVENAAFLRRVSKRSKELALAQLPHDAPPSEHTAMLADPDYDVFYGAGTVIVICASPSDWPANEDCCLAAQNLMLAAHALGLGTCPIGLAREALNEGWAREELAIPDDHSVVMPLAVGFPREVPQPTRRRAPRVLHWS